MTTTYAFILGVMIGSMLERAVLAYTPRIVRWLQKRGFGV
jgi:hypothetical protein